MIRWAPTVSLHNVQPCTLKAIASASEVFSREGVDLNVRSVCDGQHMIGSLHYKGLAFDCRSKELPDLAAKERVLNTLRVVLGSDWEVLLEKPGGLNEHFHCEYDPKK